MDICICDISALEIYQSHGRLVPELLERPRTSRLGACRLPARQMLADTVERLGATSKPYHLAFGNPSQATARSDVRRHVHTVPLPRGALIRIDRNTLISSPELLLPELAARNDFDEVDLALVGYELCGTYSLDPNEASWSGLIDGVGAITNKRRIASMVQRLGCRHGVARARRALELFEDGSNSPMETILALLLHLPRRLGGLGLGPVVMNKRVATTAGDRWVDIYFPASRVGVEYKGRKPHSIEKTARDDRRQNKLVGSGITVLNAWYEDLADNHLFEQFVQDLSRTLSIRLRIRGQGFAERQKLLRMRLMPAVERFGDFVA